MTDILSYFLVFAIFLVSVQIIVAIPVLIVLGLVKAFRKSPDPALRQQRLQRKTEKKAERIARRQQRIVAHQRRVAERKRQAEIRRANRPAVIMQRVDTMSGVEFENFVANIFRRNGYRVRTTATTGDFGADLILSGNGERICVQCKRYQKPVSLKAVQEVTSAKSFYNCGSAVVITNSHYTDAARQLAKSNSVVLYDREWLYDQVRKQNF